MAAVFAADHSGQLNLVDVTGGLEGYLLDQALERGAIDVSTRQRIRQSNRKQLVFRSPVARFLR